jgi:hypothetical protein
VNETPPSGWYSDPQNAETLRWWDGTEWTEHTSDAVPASEEPGAKQRPTFREAMAANKAQQAVKDAARKEANDEKKAERAVKDAARTEAYEGKKADRKDQSVAKKEAFREAMSRPPVKVSIAGATYLGGLPGEVHLTKTGSLYFDSDGIGLGAFSGKMYRVLWADVSGVTYDSEQLKKSRVGKALAFGVFALAAKSSKSVAEFTVVKKDGNAVFYQIDNITGHALRAKLNPFLNGIGISCLDDQVPQVAAPAVDIAGQIQKLAELHTAGILTDDEFQAKKTDLLSRM